MLENRQQETVELSLKTLYASKAYASANEVSSRSADSLGQLDDDPLGAPDVTEPVAVPVRHKLADEFGAVTLQPIEDIVDAPDRECDMTDAGRVRGSARVTASTRRRVELGQLEPCVAVRGAHHRDVRADSVEPNHAIHEAALDRGLAFQLESELGKERHRRREVVDDDAHVVHPLKRHAPDDRHVVVRRRLGRGRAAVGARDARHPLGDPEGATVDTLRNINYFPQANSLGHIAVLAVWALVGTTVALALGSHNERFKTAEAHIAEGVSSLTEPRAKLVTVASAQTERV